jgi:hypothetical protein
MKPMNDARTLLLITAAWGLLAVLGCSASSPGQRPGPEALRAIGDAYRKQQGAGPTRPARLDDLAPYLREAPAALEALKSGDVVFLYGASLRDVVEGDASATVIAYEKDAPTRGGWVVMADGLTVQEMTPEQFRKAALARPAGK